MYLFVKLKSLNGLRNLLNLKELYLAENKLENFSGL